MRLKNTIKLHVILILLLEAKVIVVVGGGIFLLILRYYISLKIIWSVYVCITLLLILMNFRKMQILITKEKCYKGSLHINYENYVLSLNVLHILYTVKFKFLMYLAFY